MTSLLEWMERLEGNRSQVIDSLEAEFGGDAWAALSPHIESSPDQYGPSSSPSVDGGFSPAVATVSQHQEDASSPFEQDAFLSPPTGEFTAMLTDEVPTEPSFFMEEENSDVLSRYLNSGAGSERMDIDLPRYPSQGYEPLFMPMPTYSATQSPADPQSSLVPTIGSFEYQLSAPLKLTDADVQWLTNNQAAPAPDPMTLGVTQPVSNPEQTTRTEEGKPKAVKDLRVEFYRQEIRKQTNDKHSAGKFRVGDVESRSPFFLSFVWREYVNTKYNIRIPPFRDPTTGMIDSRQMLRQKIRSSRTPWEQVDLDKALREAHSAGSTGSQLGRYRGDIAYYFKRSLWTVPHEEVHTLERCCASSTVLAKEDDRIAYMESFLPGDVVAVLSDGSVTKDTTRDDVAWISVVPGTDRSVVAPWKCLPEPAPEPVEEHVLVAVMGIVQIRVTGTVPERASETYVIVPSGRGDGCGVVLPQSEWAAFPSVQPIVALPLSGKPKEKEGLLLAFRSEQINVPWLQRLEDKTARLESKQEEHSLQIDAITTAVDELQTGGQTLPPMDSRERLELKHRPRLATHHSHVAASGHAPCRCISRVIEAVEEQGLSLVELLADAKENVVTVPGHPYSVQYAITRETGERLPVENVAVVAVGKSFFALQPIRLYDTEDCSASSPTDDGRSRLGDEEDSGRSSSSDVYQFTEGDIQLLKEGSYSLRVNKECSGCELLLHDRFVLRLMKVGRWKDSIEDIVALADAEAEKHLSARMRLRDGGGKRRRYIGKGRIARRIAKNLGSGLVSLEQQGQQKGHRIARKAWHGLSDRKGGDSDSTSKAEESRERPPFEVAEEAELSQGEDERELKPSADDDDRADERKSVADVVDGLAEDRARWSARSERFMQKFMMKPQATLLFCRKLVAASVQAEQLNVWLFQLSSEQQCVVAKRLSGILMEVTQRESIASVQKKRTPPLLRAQGAACKKIARDPLSYIVWAAHVITAWHVLFAADKKGYEIFATAVALQPLSVASSTPLMCEAIVARPPLMAVLDTVLSEGVPMVMQQQAMRIYLALSSTTAVVRTLGPEINHAMSYCAQLISSRDRSELRAAAVCILHALAAEASMRQRMFVQARVQEAVLLHGYEEECSADVKEMGAQLRALLRKFPLSCLNQGTDLDCNVPFRCTSVAVHRGPGSLKLKLSHLEMACADGAERTVAVLLRLPLISLQMLSSLKRSLFLELQFSSISKVKSEASKARPPSDSVGKHESFEATWTALWLLDGKLVGCTPTARSGQGMLTSICRFPFSAAALCLPASRSYSAIVAQVSENGWERSDLFHAKASEGLCVVLLTEVPRYLEFGSLALSLSHVEVL